MSWATVFGIPVLPLPFLPRGEIRIVGTGPWRFVAVWSARGLDTMPPDELLRAVRVAVARREAVDAAVRVVREGLAAYDSRARPVVELRPDALREVERRCAELVERRRAFDRAATVIERRLAALSRPPVDAALAERLERERAYTAGVADPRAFVRLVP